MLYSATSKVCAEVEATLYQSFTSSVMSNGVYMYGTEEIPNDHTFVVSYVGFVFQVTFDVFHV